MKRTIIAVIIALLSTACFADEKSELQKEVAVYQIHLQNLSISDPIYTRVGGAVKQIIVDGRGFLKAN